MKERKKKSKRRQEETKGTVRKERVKQSDGRKRDVGREEESEEQKEK